MTTREQLATALTAANVPINGRRVTCVAKRPKSLATGTAWPQIGSWDRDGPSGQFTRTWQVWVVLPSDEAAAEKWLEDHQLDLVDAVSSEIYVDRVEPILIGGEGSNIPGCMITGRSE